MANIRMFKSTLGSQNGTTIQLFEENTEYDISDRLADVFVNQMRVAEYVVKEEIPCTLEEAIQEVIEEEEKEVEEEMKEEKAMVSAPENKAMSSVDEDKTINKYKKNKKKVKIRYDY